jgi:hypothetical protein
MFFHILFNSTEERDYDLDHLSESEMIRALIYEVKEGRAKEENRRRGHLFIKERLNGIVVTLP